MDDLQNRINGSINQVINSAENAVEFEIEVAGRQVNIAIENAKMAYLDILQKTVEKVDEVVQKHLNTLTSLVESVEAKTVTSLKQFEEDTQQWIDSLPLSGWQPQLTRVSPKYVVIPEKDSEVMLKFQGNFKYASDSRYQPSFELNGGNILPVNTTTQRLDFKIKLANTSLDKRTYAIGTLKVPYETGYIFSNIKTAEYKVWIGALPLSPGKVKVYYTSQKIEQATKHIRSGTIKAWADNDCPARWVTKTSRIYPERGWYVIPSSVQQPTLHPGAHGDHGQPSIALIDSNQIITQVGLSARDGKHMGRVEYHVEFDQVQEVPVTHTGDKEINLKWGGSEILDLKDDEMLSKISYDAFDGSHNEYSGPSTSNPYLKIYFSNGKYQLSAEVPPDIL